jgi:hypothetical protein
MLIHLVRSILFNVGFLIILWAFPLAATPSLTALSLTLVMLGCILMTIQAWRVTNFFNRPQLLSIHPKRLSLRWQYENGLLTKEVRLS